MKKKVINKERITKKGKMILASFVIGTTILNGVGVYAGNDLSTSVSYSTNDSRVDNILNNIYQKQMSYLIPTMKRINEFFNSKDKNDIIKIGFPNVYEISKNNLEIKYNLTSEELVNLIRENNCMISMLSIKPAGNGRDPEYGIIRDNSELGFRKKTDEDKALINEFVSLIDYKAYLSNDVLNLVSKLNSNEDISSTLLNALRSTYSRQISLILKNREALKDFYDNVDTKGIIKNSFTSAYESYTKELNYIKYPFNQYVLNEIDVSNEDLINNYMSAIKENNIIINNFKIKPAGTGRDPEYGIISDSNSELGFRKKTKEDIELINKYTDLVEMDNDYSLISLFDYAKDKKLKNDYTLKKVK